MTNQSNPSTSSPSSSPHFQYHRSALRSTTPSPRDPTIRHSGRAHIRGKIRRVWRPRFLEVCDTGLVRYYELPPTADVTLPEDSDFYHVNMIPKDTLIIYHARIIDVTTLRDLHVGLPKGSFGFLFRGQRQLHLELVQSNEPNPPREYFCAVSTLEEAQTWVIVLQWAASMCKATHQRNHSLTNVGGRASYGGSHQNHSYGNAGHGNHHHHHHHTHDAPTIGFLGSDSCSIGAPRVSRALDDSHRFLRSGSASGSAPAVLGKPPLSEDSAMSFDKMYSNSKDDTARSRTDSSHEDESSFEFPLPPPPVSPPPKRTTGRIVVTKAHSYRLIPSGIMQWQVAYEIALLLLQPPKVEERRVLRTKADFQKLLQNLTTELDSKISLTLVEEWKPKLAAQLLPSQLTATMTIAKIVESFQFVDQMLRALAMDANIVNSHAMKHCFVLDSDTPRIVSLSTWWKVPPPSSITYQKTMAVSEDAMDFFVKMWLSPTQQNGTAYQQEPSTLEASWFWMLQRPWMVVGGVGVGIALAVPLATVYADNMVTVTLRLDVLFGSWCLAAILGKEYLATPKPITPVPPKPIPRPIKQPPRKPPPPSRVALPSSQSSAASRLKESVVVKAPTSSKDEDIDASSVDSKDDLDYLEQDGENDADSVLISKLSSPLPQYPHNNGESCWSIPPDMKIFRVRGSNYLEDRVKIASGPCPLKCRGVDVWLTDNPERHIARHPSVLNGKVHEEDTFLVNFLLPFGNFVSYFTVPPLSQFPDKLANVWTKFLQGDQQYRDKRLKLLPVVIDGPWIVKAAVGNGTAPALLGKVIPLQYFFKDPNPETKTKGVYEVDVIITASSIAKGILSVVKGHTKSLTIAFAFIIEAAEQDELPETVLCAFQVHSLHLEDCPHLPECNLDEI